MDWSGLMTDEYERVSGFVEHILDGLSKNDLDWRPKEDCNSIGWLVWHLARQHDLQIARLMDEDQLWVRDGWHLKFNMPADEGDVGFGHTPEQAAAFKSPEAKTLLDYQKAVTERSKGYFPTISGEDLDRVLDEPMFQPLPTVGVRLVSIVQEAVTHAGQAAYLRGLLQGRGWQTF